MYYTGLLKDTNVAEVFYSRTVPSTLTHGNLYNFLFGGYKTRQEAEQVAHYQYPNATIRFFDGRMKSCITDHNLYAIAKIA
jgi:hypothetical protein